jgi:type VI secretion system protein
MRCSLFEAFSEGAGQDQGVHLIPEDQQQLASILASLHRVLNSRRGSRRHLPDFGLPDLGEVYRGAPESYELLAQAIKEAVEKYEPRLTRVRVTREPSEADPTQLRFLLTAQLASRERLMLETVFTMSYEAHIRSRESAR